MGSKRLLVLGSVFLFTVFLLTLLSSQKEYERFEPVNETAERVYADCNCFGSMRVMESYPPQYNCEGINYCRKTNYTRKR